MERSTDTPGQGKEEPSQDHQEENLCRIEWMLTSTSDEGDSKVVIDGSDRSGREAHTLDFGRRR